MQDQVTRVRGRFIGVGDNWLCDCGNTSHHEGFFACLETGEFVDPSDIDTELFRCARCGVIIEYVEPGGDGYLVGVTEPAFFGRRPF